MMVMRCQVITMVALPMIFGQTLAASVDWGAAIGPDEPMPKPPLPRRCVNTKTDPDSVSGLKLPTDLLRIVHSQVVTGRKPFGNKDPLGQCYPHHLPQSPEEMIKLPQYNGYQRANCMGLLPKGFNFMASISLKIAPEEASDWKPECGFQPKFKVRGMSKDPTHYERDYCWTTDIDNGKFFELEFDHTSDDFQININCYQMPQTLPKGLTYPIHAALENRIGGVMKETIFSLKCGVETFPGREQTPVRWEVVNTDDAPQTLNAALIFEPKRRKLERAWQGAVPSARETDRAREAAQAKAWKDHKAAGGFIYPPEALR